MSVNPYTMRMISSIVSETLQNHFDDRKKRRPEYSMRAYARDLHLSPSFLSQLLSQKKNLSERMALKLTKSLKLNSKDREYFLTGVQAGNSRQASLRASALEDLNRIKKARLASVLSKDEFAIISDWYHLAIFQTLFLKKYLHACKSEREDLFLARFLKITHEEAANALERLKRMKFIVSRGTYHEPLVEQIRTQNVAPSAAIRKYHKQMMGKALVAMQAQPLHERTFSTTTLTIRKEDLPELNHEYEKFYQRMIHQFSKKSDSTPEANSVYAVSTQIFSLSHK